MKRAGIDVLVSMLQVDEAAELGLSSEAELCEARGIVFSIFLDPGSRNAVIIILPVCRGFESGRTRRT